MALNAAEISQIIKERIETFNAVAKARSEGTIVSIKDGLLLQDLPPLFLYQPLELPAGLL